MYTFQDVKEALIDTGRLLLFQEVKPDVKRKWPLYLTIGLGFAWLAGIGRYWDNPRATFMQHLGVGSVLYCFILALLLWLIIWPLRPANWSYLNVLVFVSMTSPPALLYAIPVEKLTSIVNAIQINILLLAIVAVWRMALLITYLRRSAKLGAFGAAISALIPVDIVIVILTILNLDHVVFEIMGGLRKTDLSPHDGAYAILFMITLLSFYALPVLVIAYICVSVQRTAEVRKEAGVTASVWKNPSASPPSNTGDTEDQDS